MSIPIFWYNRINNSLNWKLFLPKENLENIDSWQKDLEFGRIPQDSNLYVEPETFVQILKNDKIDLNNMKLDLKYYSEMKGAGHQDLKYGIRIKNEKQRQEFLKEIFIAWY